MASLRFLEMEFPYAEFSTTISPAVEKAVEEGSSPSTLILNRFSKDSITIGYLDDPDECVDIDFCREMGIPVMRRRNTGGAILGGKGGAFMVLSLDTGEPWVPCKTLQQGFQMGLTALACAIREVLGLYATWRPLNDVEVRGKKVVASSARLEHGILTLRMVINVNTPQRAILQRAMKVPPEKMKDKAVSSAAQRVSSLEEELGKEVSEADINRVVKAAIKGLLGDVELKTGHLTQKEKLYANEFQERFSSDGWFWGRSKRSRALQLPPDILRSEGIHKAPAGIVRVTLWARRGRLADVLITGDFHARPLTIVEELEQALIGKEAAFDVVEETVRGIFGSPGVELPGMEPQDFLLPFAKALEGLDRGRR